MVHKTAAPDFSEYGCFDVKRVYKSADDFGNPAVYSDFSGKYKMVYRNGNWIVASGRLPNGIRMNEYKS